MPRPGVLGALLFDKTNVSKFLSRWNRECDDYGLSNVERCVRFPDYCTPEIERAVEYFEGYLEKDWEKFQGELERAFWQYEEKRDTMAELCKLVREGPTMDVNLFSVQYSAISGVLESAGELSRYDRLNYFIDGLTEGMRKKVYMYASEHNWRLLSGDKGATEVKFAQLKAYIDVLASGEQRRLIRERERAVRENRMAPEIAAVSQPLSGAAVIAPKASPPIVQPRGSVSSFDPIADLSKSFERLALAMEKVAVPGPTNASSSVPNYTYTGNRPTSPHPPCQFRCNWCDVQGHFMDRCDNFQRALEKGVVCYNDRQ